MTTEKKPVVSVIMPAYNKERFVETAIRSVMGQTYTDWELLIIDDASGDATCAIAEGLSEEDTRIRLIRNEGNLGAAKTRNRGFGLCRGKYIALLDSDDVWYPEKLERQVAHAEKTGAEIIYCSYGIIDAEGKKICDDFIVPEETCFEDFLTSAVISCSTALLSRKIIENYRFEAEYYHEDLAFWLKVLRDGNQARGVQEVLAEYRVMDGTRASNKVKSAMFRWKIYRNLLGIPFGRRVKLMWQYAFLGLKKYRKRTEVDYE